MKLEKSKKAKKRTLALCVAAFCLVYILFALKPLGAELHLTPEWTVDMTQVSQVEEDAEFIPFRLGQNMGYFTQDGKVASCMTFPFKAAISDMWYASYGSSNNSVDFYNFRGQKAGTIKEYGFPFFDEDRIYVFLPGGTSFVQCDTTGERRWVYESYAPVTAFSSSDGGTVAGFADGTIVSFTEDGTVNHKFTPGGSDVEVILGADISNDGSKVACVSGQKQQRFVVAEKNGVHSRVIFHENISSSLMRQTKVKFSRDDSTVYYNYDGGLGVVDLTRTNPKSLHIPLKGTVTQIEESSVADLVFVLSRDGNEYTVTVIEPLDHVAARFSFKGHSAFIQVRNDAVFVGHDNKISRLTVSKK